MRRILPSLIILLCVGASLPATADARSTLNGAYAFAGDRTCTVASAPFVDDASGAPTIIPGPVIRQSAVDTGTFTFKVDGTGTQAGQSTTIDIGTTTVGTSIYAISEFSVPFNYVVNPDNSLGINFGQGTFTIVLGAGAGETGTLGPRSEHDQLGEGGTIFVAGPSPGIEQQTVTVNEPGGGSFTQYRLCVKSGTRPRLQ